MDFEASGYFRQRDWYKSTPALIMIGEKQDLPTLHEVYNNALQWAVKLAHTENVSGRKGGLAVYKALADDLIIDKDFPDDPRVLRERMIVIFSDAIEILTDGRLCGSFFLKKIGDEKPELANELYKAAEYYQNIVFLAIQCKMLMDFSVKSMLIQIFSILHK